MSAPLVVLLVVVFLLLVGFGLTTWVGRRRDADTSGDEASAGTLAPAPPRQGRAAERERAPSPQAPAPPRPPRPEPEGLDLDARERLEESVEAELEREGLAPPLEGGATTPEQPAPPGEEIGSLPPATLEPAAPEAAAPVGEPDVSGSGPTPTRRSRVRERLGRAREALGGSLTAIRGRSKVDESTFEELEEALLLADVGLPTTQRLLEDLRARVRSGEVAETPEAVLDALKDDVVGLFDGDDRALAVGTERPAVWLVVGVNGAGKTTTIGKLAAREATTGRKVVLAAGDTFRAAAGEQLETWAERSGSDIVRGAEGADPSSVVFDAVQHAAARGADLVLADTAGRLHTKVNLMEELRKVRRVADRPPGHVREVLLVLDATTGQNGLAQARQFTEAVEVTGVVLTKLDGTAKGGIVCAIRAELGLPIKLVGIGESVEDLVEFEPEEFAEALFA